MSGRGIQTNPRLVAAIAQKEPPRSLRELQAFLGLCNYYQRFVPHFSQVIHRLKGLTKKAVSYVWGTDQQEAFAGLQWKLTEEPVLAFPQNEGMFTLDMDASQHSVEAVLSQDQDGEEKVIAYGSAAMTATQTRYRVTRQELLAVLRFTRQFRRYLLVWKCCLWTDHTSLVWLFHFKRPEGQLARWLEEHSQFDFVVEHWAGERHANADGMSHLNVDEGGTCDCYSAGVT